MSNIQIKNVDPDFHEAARQRAASEGHTLGEYLLELIRRDLLKPSRREWLARAAALTRTAIENEVLLAGRDRDREERRQ